VGQEHLNLVAASGGKVVLTNLPIASSRNNQGALVFPVFSRRDEPELCRAGHVQCITAE